ATGARSMPSSRSSRRSSRTSPSRTPTPRRSGYPGFWCLWKPARAVRNIPRPRPAGARTKTAGRSWTVRPAAASRKRRRKALHLLHRRLRARNDPVDVRIAHRLGARRLLELALLPLLGLRLLLFLASQLFLTLGESLGGFLGHPGLLSTPHRTA